MTFHVIFEIEHIDISTENHFPKTVGMKVELIFDKFLEMLKRLKKIFPLEVLNGKIILDRSRDISSKLPHIFSIDDRLVLIRVQTTCIAFPLNTLPVTNFPSKKHRTRN